MTEPRLPTLTWRSAGQTPVAHALIFHGLTATPKEVAELGRSLYSVFGIDVTIPCLSGHGGSLEQLMQTPTSAWYRDLTDAHTAVSARAPEITLVAGLSFGALLALAYAEHHPDSVSALALLSPLITLRSRPTELWLRVLSLLPEPWLNRFGTRIKRERDAGLFPEGREAFPEHSIGATARAWKIRRAVLRDLSKVRCPVLLAYDPGDHHLLPCTVQPLIDGLSHVPHRVESFPGAEHEMTIGPRRAEVIRCVAEFFKPILMGSGAG